MSSNPGDDLTEAALVLLARKLRRNGYDEDDIRQAMATGRAQFAIMGRAELAIRTLTEYDDTEISGWFRPH